MEKEKKKVKVKCLHPCNNKTTIDNIYTVLEFDRDGCFIINDAGGRSYLFEGQYELIEEWHPKRGELVEVSYDGKEWKERIYVSTIDGARYPYIVVYKDSEDKFISGDIFDYSYIKYIRQIKQQPKLDIKITVNGEEKTLEELNKIVNNYNE